MEKFKGFWRTLAFVVGLGVLIAAGVALVCRLLDDKAYEEKWKEYDECGVQ